jgi:GGDEF domain-containing protein
MSRNVSQLAEIAARLTESDHLDSLTGLENRNHFHEHLMSALRVPRRERLEENSSQRRRLQFFCRSLTWINRADRTLHNIASSHQEASHWPSSLA